MTIVVSVQCSEGIVLAADSAVALFQEHNTFVWPHAKKLSHIGSYNIGALSWGLGTIGQRNIQSLIYEFEVNELSRYGQNDIVTVSGVTDTLFDFLNKKHLEVYGNNADPKYGLGMIIAGYSQDSFVPEQYRFVLPVDRSPRKIDFHDNTGIIFDGLTDSIYRLVHGIDYTMALALSRISLTNGQRDQLAQALDAGPRGPSRENIDELIKLNAEDSDEFEKFYGWKNLMTYDIIRPGMPLQDGIDLACWLIEVTIGRYRFAYNIPLVGGAIDIAVITHSNYTWIQRKSWHGYERMSSQFNSTKKEYKHESE
jgi:hypothetical protein